MVGEGEQGVGGTAFAIAGPVHVFIDLLLHAA